MENPPLAVASDVAAILSIVVISYSLRGIRWFFRLPITTAVGWPILIVGVVIHWQLLADAATTPEAQDWVANHDGGPLAMVAVFGWIFSLVIALVSEIVVIQPSKMIARRRAKSASQSSKST
jgi:hypothetical protein